METIKVNMNPNPLDVQTIHASQNDGEARQWEFELHNNGELIDTSEITEQLFFKAYKGGTEQILPENTSTPTTSPFKGDIKYPQGLLSDQEFTYRQSPTEEDGLAKITDIKGNTLVWNQLVQNGNFADGLTNWSKSTSADTATVSNNVLSFHANSVYGSISNTLPTDINNHLTLVKAQVRITGNDGTVRVKVVNDMAYTNNTFAFSITEKNVWKDVLMYGVYQTTPSTSSSMPRIGFQDYRSASSDNLIEVKNVQVFDLTQMGLDISSPSGFTSLFPLSYYSYNQGSLLSFNGNGIKTVGFNQWDEEWEVGEISTTNGENVAGSNIIRSKNYIPVFPNTVYYFKTGNIAVNTYRHFYDADKNYLGYVLANTNSVLTTPTNACYMRFRLGTAYGATYNNDICINISSDKNGTYEPYTSSTLSLPISTYFPNGMKSAGNVYDELTESKAITRIGAIDLGSLTWEYRQPGSFSWYRFDSQDVQDLIGVNTSNTICARYSLSTVLTNAQPDKTFAINPVNGKILIRDSSYTDATAFKTSMSGVYLYYELATPTETSFSTASLVTENAEIPLSNEDGVLIGKCTEELSAEPGFHDAKIKLSDSDGECYSNKIQLHVERSPQ